MSGVEIARDGGRGLRQFGPNWSGVHLEDRDSDEGGAPSGLADERQVPLVKGSTSSGRSRWAVWSGGGRRRKRNEARQGCGRCGATCGVRLTVFCYIGAHAKLARVIVVTSLVLALPATALAGDPPRAAAPITQPTPGQVQAARELFKAATSDEDAARWTDALEKLHRVADVKLTASVRYHIAFCEEKLKGRSRRRSSTTPKRRTRRTRSTRRTSSSRSSPIHFLPDLRARVPTLTIDVPSDVTGVTVTIDDHPHPQGRRPGGSPFRSIPGAHRGEAATAQGRVPFRADLTLKEREVTVLDVTLPLVHAAPPVVSASPADGFAPPGIGAAARARSFRDSSLSRFSLSSIDAPRGAHDRLAPPSFIGGGVAAPSPWPTPTPARRAPSASRKRTATA